MTETKQRKSLIIYTSIFGNTEQIAISFKKMFEKQGWQCDMLKVTKNMDMKKHSFNTDEYDLICMGSPVWHGVPTKEIFDNAPFMLLKGAAGLSGITQPRGIKKGIVFVTYGGDRRGTPEATPALHCLELRLEDMGINVVGKFACPGGNKWSRIPVNTVAQKKGWNVGDAASAISRFKDNPDAPEFAKLSEEDRKMFEKAAKQTKDLPTDPEVPGSRGFHWDVYNRPNERDEQKAAIFMEEIIEDFFGGGIEAAPRGHQSLCIA